MWYAFPHLTITESQFFIMCCKIWPMREISWKPPSFDRSSCLHRLFPPWLSCIVFPYCLCTMGSSFLLSYLFAYHLLFGLNWAAYYLVQWRIGSDHCILVIDIHSPCKFEIFLYDYLSVFLFFCVFDTISLQCSDWHFMINILLVEVFVLLLIYNTSRLFSLWLYS